MANKLNPFEDQLKQAAEKHNVSYDASQWDLLEKKLNYGASQSGKRSWYLMGLAAAIIVMGLGVFSMIETSEPPVVANNSVVINEFEPSPNDNKKVEKTTLKEQPIKDTWNKSSSTKKTKEPKKSAQIIPQTINEKEKNSTPGNTNVSHETNKKDNSKTIENQIVVKTEEEEIVEIPHIVLSNNSICAGQIVSASLSEGDFEDVIWHLGDGTVVNSKELSHAYLEEGVYQLRAYVNSLKEFTSEVSVHIKPKPDPTFTIRDNLERGMIPVKYMSVNTGGEKSYVWSLGDGTNLRGEGVTHTYRKPGDYEVSLRVVNKHGCSWMTFQRITIEKEFNLLAPNSFSPNGDGINDGWMPLALETGYYNFELKVYNRNSKLIFETNSPDDKFNGTDRGTLAPSGEIFIWKAFTEDPNGIRQEYGGTMISIY